MVKIYLSMLNEADIQAFLKFKPKSFVRAFERGEKDYLLADLKAEKSFSEDNVLEVK